MNAGWLRWLLLLSVGSVAACSWGPAQAPATQLARPLLDAKPVLIQELLLDRKDVGLKRVVCVRFGDMDRDGDRDLVALVEKLDLTWPSIYWWPRRDEREPGSGNLRSLFDFDNPVHVDQGDWAITTFELVDLGSDGDLDIVAWENDSACTALRNVFGTGDNWARDVFQDFGQLQEVETWNDQVALAVSAGNDQRGPSVAAASTQVGQWMVSSIVEPHVWARPPAPGTDRRRYHPKGSGTNRLGLTFLGADRIVIANGSKVQGWPTHAPKTDGDEPAPWPEPSPEPELIHEDAALEYSAVLAPPGRSDLLFLAWVKPSNDIGVRMLTRSQGDWEAGGLVKIGNGLPIRPRQMALGSTDDSAPPVLIVAKGENVCRFSVAELAGDSDWTKAAANVLLTLAGVRGGAGPKTTNEFQSVSLEDIQGDRRSELLLSTDQALVLVQNVAASASPADKSGLSPRKVTVVSDWKGLHDAVAAGGDRVIAFDNPEIRSRARKRETDVGADVRPDTPDGTVVVFGRKPDSTYLIDGRLRDPLNHARIQTDAEGLPNRVRLGSVHVLPGCSVTLSHIRIEHEAPMGWQVSQTQGGAIWNEGEVILAHSSIVECSTHGPGGGIYNASYSRAILSDVSISDCSAGQGGGIYNSENGVLKIDSHCVISANHAYRRDENGDYGIYGGGGLFNAGELQLRSAALDDVLQSNIQDSYQLLNWANGERQVTNDPVWSRCQVDLLDLRTPFSAAELRSDGWWHATQLKVKAVHKSVTKRRIGSRLGECTVLELDLASSNFKNLHAPERLRDGVRSNKPFVVIKGLGDYDGAYDILANSSSLENATQNVWGRGGKRQFIKIPKAYSGKLGKQSSTEKGLWFALEQSEIDAMRWPSVSGRVDFSGVLGDTSTVRIALIGKQDGEQAYLAFTDDTDGAFVFPHVRSGDYEFQLVASGVRQPAPQRITGKHATLPADVTVKSVDIGGVVLTPVIEEADSGGA